MTTAVQFVRDIYQAKAALKRPVISFEFFPPKTPEGDLALIEKTIPALLETRPDYCSVTYGAGGSTRDKTLTIVDQIQRQHRLTTVAHLTCVSTTRHQIHHELEEFHRRGILNVLALRGDPPAGTGEFQTMPGGFTYAYELVELIKAQGGFSIGVAGFPEGHIACKDGKEVDWQRLKAKIDCGADYVLTQLFFDNRDFFGFRDYLTRLGVTVPLCPGIIPILSAGQIKRFTALCGARIPDALARKLEQIGDDDPAATEFGIEYATRQCDELLRAGVPGIHFYTLNKARSTVAILKNLGLDS